MSWLADFHFIRPWALLAFLPLTLLWVLLWFNKRRANGWQDMIAPELIGYLVDNPGATRKRSLLWVLALIWALASLALAGPSWEQRPSEVQRQTDALVIALDLSPSMVAEDISPTRLIRARLKIADILKRREEGETALIAYGGDAHVVTPLTDDTETIASLLTSMGPGVMPLPGSNTEAAIDRAAQMLSDAGHSQGEILLVTDGVNTDAFSGIRDALKRTRYRLSILGIGTDEGAPIPSGRGGFIRDSAGAVVITRLDSNRLQNFARELGGRYATSHYDSRDLDYLFSAPLLPTGEHKRTDKTLDQWYDRGPWLTLILLPFVLYCFRRGLLVTLFMIPVALLLQTPKVQAAELNDFLLTPDQQGARALEQGDAATAAEKFRHPGWKGTAAYRAGDYEAAANYFTSDTRAEGHYNRGNALARAGKLDEALAAYDQALAQNSELKDAATAKALVENLKEQQEQQQNNSEGQDSDSGDQSQDKSDSSKSEKPQAGQPQDQDGENNEERDPGDQQSEQSSSAGNGADNQQSNPDQQSGEDTSTTSSAGNQNQTPNNEPEAQSDPQQDTQENQPQNNEQSNGEAQTSSSSGAQTSSAAAQEASEQDAQMAQAEAAAKETDQEAEQAMAQWLRQIPDDPSGLLRNKFRYEYQQKTRERMDQKLNTFDTDEQRW